MAAAQEPSAKRIKLSHKVNYSDGLFLAPMVRCGTLPTRLLSLDYGASLVWGPEIVDKAIIGTERVVLPENGVVQYQKNGRSIWETHPIEKDRLIYQIGSSDPALALKAAKTVEQDVSGIDLNCGCPKDFSLKGGMGAALLKTPDKLCEILRTLVAGLSLPVSAKIRLLPTQENTLDLVRQIVATGISCLTVHCRTQEMRPREPALLNRLRDIVDAVKEFGIPVVANGDCWGTKDKEKICELTGVTSIMLARGGEANPSCFQLNGEFLDPIDVVIPRYIRVAMSTSNHFSNSKYCINAMDLGTTSKPPAPGIKAKRAKLKQDMTRVKTYEDICKLFEMDYAEVSKETLEQVLPDLREKLQKEEQGIEKAAFDEEEQQELRHKPNGKGVTDKRVPAVRDSAWNKENSKPTTVIADGTVLVDDDAKVEEPSPSSTAT